MTAAQRPRNLDELVVAVASLLMPVQSDQVTATYQEVLHTLVDFLGVDTSFLRRNDHEQGVSILLAEWPPRRDVPDPDPLGVVPFEGSDPIFAASEDLQEPLIVRPGAAMEYEDRVQEASGIPAATVVGIPLLGPEGTMGALGLVKFGDRDYNTREINALTAIGSLIAQAGRRTQAEQHVRYVAFHDDLTGLANRRGLTGLLEERLGPGAEAPVTVMHIDVDRFKAVNEFISQAAGDQYLRGLARRFEIALPTGAIAARLSGDEFVVVFAEPLDDDAASELATSVLLPIGSAIRAGGQEVGRTVSVGVASAVPGEAGASELLSTAAQAARAAKAQGGDAVRVFTREMRAQVRVRNDIELGLGAAIENGDLRLQFQPEVDLRDGRLVGAEALVRWRHPTYGLLPPDEFIGVAEVAHLTGLLDHWVLDAACAHLAAWVADEPNAEGLVLRVNVSPAQIIGADFAGYVEEMLQRYGLDGSQLCLELTEHAVVGDVDAARATLGSLRRLGVHTAIDDFGTGYSSLGQLKLLPVDAVKIDKGFVTDLSPESQDTAIVSSIVGLARALGLDVVAEGVQTPMAARTLVDLGCYNAQGYLIGKPMDPVDLLAVIQAGGVRLFNGEA
ncbi:MAG: putative bifunctional diguanylate cyclase/phosphodiesterase [Mycobacteriales bacterium]